MDLMVTKAKLESDVSHLKETQVWPLTKTFNTRSMVYWSIEYKSGYSNLAKK